jgi:SAM-dependent methyltransferase
MAKARYISGRRSPAEAAECKHREKGDPIGTNLPDGCCDAIFMRHVYHHFANLRRLSAILRALNSGGLLAIIDFPPRKWLNATPPLDGALKKHGGHGVPDKVL